MIIQDKMKAQFFLIPLAILAVSCGTSRTAIVDPAKDEFVDMGYGKISKKSNTYSVGDLKTKDNETAIYSNIYDYLRGRVAGVDVRPNNQVIIRGINTINASTDPLFIVNGIEVPDISNIPPHDVKSITVLKDASASIYGARGGNGVIIIELKGQR